MSFEGEENQGDKRLYTLGEEKPAKAVLKMGIPVTIGMLFMVAYNLTDTFFIGLMHDNLQLAAVNLSYPIMMVTIAVAGIVGNGGASYIARCMGAGEIDKARHVLTNGLELIVIFSVVITALGLLFINPVVNVLGAKPDTFEPTKDYTCVMLIGSLFTMDNYAIGQLLRSEGSTLYSMVGMIAGNVVNIILDPIFIFTLGMKIKGAAIATVLGNVLGVGIYLFYYAKKDTLLVPSKKFLRFDKQIFKEIMVVGTPHTLEQFLTTAAIIVSNNLAAGYGAAAVAGMGIANKIMSFGNYVYQGMAAGCQPLMGYNYGAKNYSRMKQLINSSEVIIFIMEIGVIGIYGIFAPALVSLFSVSDEVIGIGSKALRAAMLMLPFAGATCIVRNTFNAMGKAGYAFLITAVRQLALYIPFLLAFNHLWGFTGLIYAQPVEEFICMFLASALLSIRLKKIAIEGSAKQPL